MKEEILAIKKSVKENDCTFFLGAGIAREAGLIDAGNLCEILLKELPTYGDDRRNLRKISQEYARNYTNISLKRKIEEKNSCRPRQ